MHQQRTVEESKTPKLFIFQIIYYQQISVYCLCKLNIYNAKIKLINRNKNKFFKISNKKQLKIVNLNMHHRN